MRECDELKGRVTVWPSAGWLIVSISVVVSLVVAISVISFIDRIDRNIK